MNEGFSGQPVTRWNDDYRTMVLLEEFYYIDPDGEKWIAPVGSELNGATIPRQLWGIVGSPYVGKYRRASIVHDVHVGEGANKDVSKEHRMAADRMFYHACLNDGCSRKFAKMLYIGVRIGTLASKTKSLDDSDLSGSEFIDTRTISLEESEITSKFWKLVDSPTTQTKDLGSEIDFESLDKEIENLFPY